MNNPIRPIACPILDIKKESLYEYTFRVSYDTKVNHGQFMQLSIPKFGEAPISISAFGEGYLEFTIRAVGKVTDEIFNKKVGDLLFLRGPYGNGWPFEAFKGKDLIFITGGTGLAPVRSMLNACYKEDLAKSITLIAGFKNEDSIVFDDELNKWQNKFKTYYTLDKAQKDGWNTGFVTDFVDKIDFSNLNDYALIIVGPPMMMKYTGLKALECGAKEENIWMSFERKMSCAIGKCGHCRIDEVYVCLDGPVFPYIKAKDLID